MEDIINKTNNALIKGNKQFTISWHSMEAFFEVQSKKVHEYNILKRNQTFIKLEKELTSIEREKYTKVSRKFVKYFQVVRRVMGGRMDGHQNIIVRPVLFFKYAYKTEKNDICFKLNYIHYFVLL